MSKERQEFLDTDLPISIAYSEPAGARPEQQSRAGFTGFGRGRGGISGRWYDFILFSPKSLSFIGLKTHSVNEIITPGTNVKIVGRKMKFNETVADEGIFIINSKGLEHKLPYYDESKPSMMKVFIPQLPVDGEKLYFEIRYRNGSDELKKFYHKITLSPNYFTEIIKYSTIIIIMNIDFQE